LAERRHAPSWDKCRAPSQVHHRPRPGTSARTQWSTDPGACRSTRRSWSKSRDCSPPTAASPCGSRASAAPTELRRLAGLLATSLLDLRPWYGRRSDARQEKGAAPGEGAAQEECGFGELPGWRLRRPSPAQLPWSLHPKVVSTRTPVNPLSGDGAETPHGVSRSHARGLPAPTVDEPGAETLRC
jgi:hypothetical protein